MADFGIKVSKSGDDVLTTADKDLAVVSKYETVKVSATGTLTAVLPEETIVGGAGGDSKTYTDTFAHGLGYAPFYAPSAANIINSDYGTTDDFDVNENCYFVPVILGYGPATDGEWCNLSIDSTNITLTVTRASSIGVDNDFGEHDVTCDYTVFFQRVDDEFSLL